MVSFCGRLCGSRVSRSTRCDKSQEEGGQVLGTPLSRPWEQQPTMLRIARKPERCRPALAQADDALTRSLDP